MKYFVYQTSFLKNTEYDANNIIAVGRFKIQAIQEDKGDVQKFVEKIPFKLITAAEHDEYLNTVDAESYEKSIQTQLKTAWYDFTNLFGKDGDQEGQARMSQKRSDESRLK